MLLIRSSTTDLPKESHYKYQSARPRNVKEVKKKVGGNLADRKKEPNLLVRFLRYEMGLILDI